jgi:asparagine synthase (glutamine-hydrolysing)
MVGPWRKRVLKAAMRRDLPREVLQRPKRGFGMPLDRWFREDLRSLTESRLLGERCLLAAYVDHGQVRRIWQEHQSGHSDQGFVLWLLLTLEVFLRRELGR